MLIVIDNNYPIIVFKIDNFQELEYKTLKKELVYWNQKASKDKIKIYLNVDLYFLESYSNDYILSIIEFVNKHQIINYDSIKIFINKINTGYLLKALFYIVNYKSTISLELIELDEEKKWK